MIKVKVKTQSPKRVVPSRSSGSDGASPFKHQNYISIFNMLKKTFKKDLNNLTVQNPDHERSSSSETELSGQGGVLDWCSTPSPTSWPAGFRLTPQEYRLVRALNKLAVEKV